MGSELRLRITEDGADADRLAMLTTYLRDELVGLGVPDVAHERGGAAPPGARAFELAAVGGLLVTLNKSAESLRSVVRALRGWVGRGEDGARSVRIELDGDVLQIANASSADLDRLINLFVDRHEPS